MRDETKLKLWRVKMAFDLVLLAEPGCAEHTARMLVREGEGDHNIECDEIGSFPVEKLADLPSNYDPSILPYGAPRRGPLSERTVSDWLRTEKTVTLQGTPEALEKAVAYLQAYVGRTLHIEMKEEGK